MKMISVLLSKVRLVKIAPPIKLVENTTNLLVHMYTMQMKLVVF